jgi:hypothetical protein
MERFSSLEQIHKMAWNLVFRAAVSRNDAMRTPVMATTDGNRPHQRTIVLREVDVQREQLFFFSDIRTPKIQHLKSQSELNLLFWDPRKKVQIEMAGTGFVFSHNNKAKAFWEKLNIAGRSSYASEATPGTPVSTDQGYLPDFWADDMALEQTNFAYDRFAIIQMQVQHLDVLHLHDKGHQRAQFDKLADGNWASSWVVP